MKIRMVSGNPALALVLVEELEEIDGVSVELTTMPTSGRLEIENCECDVVVVFESIVTPWIRSVAATGTNHRAPQVVGTLTNRWTAKFDPIDVGFVGTVDMSDPTHVIVRELQKVITNNADVTKPTCAGRVGTMSTVVCLDTVDRRFLAHIAMGMSDRQIADKVFMSPQSVRNRVSRLLERTALHNRTQMALACLFDPRMLAVNPTTVDDDVMASDVRSEREKSRR